MVWINYLRCHALADTHHGNSRMSRVFRFTTYHNTNIKRESRENGNIFRPCIFFCEYDNMFMFRLCLRKGRFYKIKILVI